MDVLTAIGRCSKTCRRFPAPIELREAATGSPDERALHAWGIALDAYDRLGSYASPDFDDSRLAVALETCGGWQAFYNQKREFLRRDFLMAYKALLRSAAPPRTLLHGLPGGPGRVVVEDHDPLYLPSGEQPPKRMDDVSPELATGIRRRMLRDVSRPKETE